VEGTQLTAEQKTKISHTLFSRSDVPRLDHVDFSVSVGTAVPSHVHVATLPDSVVQIYPQWRGDEYVVVRDEIIVVDHTRKVVAVIPAGSSGRASASSTTTVVDLSPTEIREVQTVLIQKGYLHGHADGEWNTRTREALISFQKKEGVGTRGRVDSRTIQALGLSGRIQAGANGKESTGSGAHKNSATSGQGSHNTTGMGGKSDPSATSGKTQGLSNSGSPREHSQNGSSKPNNSDSKKGTTGSGSMSNDSSLDAPAKSTNHSTKSDTSNSMDSIPNTKK